MKADQLFGILKAATCGAYAVTIDQSLVYWNDAAERILGHKAHEVLGRRCYEVVRGRSAAALTPECVGGCPSIRHLRSGLVPSPVRLQVLCSSGVYKWVTVTPMVVAGAYGDAPLLVHLFEEVRDSSDDNTAGSLKDAMAAGGADIVSDHPNEIAAPSGPMGLSRRELEVLRMVALGWDTGRIADDLSISRHTVRNHIRNLRHKLNATNKLDAVVKGIRMGLLPMGRTL